MPMVYNVCIVYNAYMAKSLFRDPSTDTDLPIHCATFTDLGRQLGPVGHGVKTDIFNIAVRRFVINPLNLLATKVEVNADKPTTEHRDCWIFDILSNFRTLSLFMLN